MVALAWLFNGGSFAANTALYVAYENPLNLGAALLSLVMLVWLASEAV